MGNTDPPVPSPEKLMCFWEGEHVSGQLIVSGSSLGFGGKTRFWIAQGFYAKKNHSRTERIKASLPCVSFALMCIH